MSEALAGHPSIREARDLLAGLADKANLRTVRASLHAAEISLESAIGTDWLAPCGPATIDDIEPAFARISDLLRDIACLDAVDTLELAICRSEIFAAHRRWTA